MWHINCFAKKVSKNDLRELLEEKYKLKKHPYFEKKEITTLDEKKININNSKGNGKVLNINGIGMNKQNCIDRVNLKDEIKIFEELKT